MSTNREPQKKAFQFLLEKCNTQQLFTVNEFKTATGWSEESFKTYRSKQFKNLLIPMDEDRFRVSFAFRRFGTWQKFRDSVVTQNRRLTREYKRDVHENVVVFEFFMPLRNEEYLRDALDGLFYKDSLRFRLKALPEEELHEQAPVLAGENDENYLNRICDWLSHKFIGYSISHVSGRFRSGSLKTREEAIQDAASKTHKYLVDETTAVVRFIFPCTDQNPLREMTSIEANQREVIQKEAMRIRWFFHQLFVGSVLEIVSGEDEIWLLETGMSNQLHIYTAEDEE